MIRDTLATFSSEEKSLADVETLLEARGKQFFVALEGKDLRGFVTFGLFRAGSGYAATCEHSVIVAPDAHRHHLGQALMAEAQQAAQDQGFRIMVAAISSANRQAVAFHTALGFAQVGYMPQVGRKAGQWLDLILMQKNLGERG